ncbi:hypothetical protein NHX12_030537, partial [Muraenolepis orangiensis]
MLQQISPPLLSGSGGRIDGRNTHVRPVFFPLKLEENVNFSWGSGGNAVRRLRAPRCLKDARRRRTPQVFFEEEAAASAVSSKWDAIDPAPVEKSATEPRWEE